MNKKVFSIIIVIILILIAFGCISYCIDKTRVNNDKEPILTIKLISEDGSKTTYIGFGYKVIRYTGINEVRIGNIFMNYILPDDTKEIATLDDFYNTSITQGKDVRKISRNYSIFDAQKDNAFVVGKRTFNGYYYNDFIESYNKGKMSYIRIASTTNDEDLVLKDVLYSSTRNRIYIVIDNTRNESIDKNERNIDLVSYEKIAEVGFEGKNYLIAYNNELNKDNPLNQENSYVVAELN